jgi:hypothetical protein
MMCLLPFFLPGQPGPGCGRSGLVSARLEFSGVKNRFYKLRIRCIVRMVRTDEEFSDILANIRRNF